MWKLIRDYRTDIGKVCDLGAGDGRFARGGSYERYVGLELDPARNASTSLPRNAAIVTKCAFEEQQTYDLVMGNPPYIRHHDLSTEWRARAAARIATDVDVIVDGRSNAYVYFFWLSLALAKSDGLCALLIPSDWTYRPSATGLRKLLDERGWAVDVHRLDTGTRVFPGVLTTATITIVDKASTAGSLTFYDRTGRSAKYAWAHRSGPTARGGKPLSYEDRGRIYASRGFSSGAQQVFLLTEEERRAAGILRAACVPALPSLRGIPSNCRTMTKAVFEKYVVKKGKRCWLLRTDPLTPTVSRWLRGVPPHVKRNSTCSARTPWYAYELPEIPCILYASGFRGKRPKILRNEFRVRAVGAVHGVFGLQMSSHRVSSLTTYLRGTDFDHGVMAHAGGLRKIDVRQMNGILNRHFKDNKGPRAAG
jgi:hypothetical protein